MIGIEVLKNLAPDQDWVSVNGDYDQFHVYGDVEIYEDYVACTVALMRKAAIKSFVFPFYPALTGSNTPTSRLKSKMLRRSGR